MDSNGGSAELGACCVAHALGACTCGGLYKTVIAVVMLVFDLLHQFPLCPASAFHRCIDGGGGRSERRSNADAAARVRYSESNGCAAAPENSR